MNNFELIDDYLANRLEGQEREGFEKQLANDPALQSDVNIQKQIVEGIRKARAAELKTMLSKVSVSGGFQIDFSVARLAAGVITAGVVGAALYYYMKPGDLPPIENASADLTKKTNEVKAAADSASIETEAPVTKTEIIPVPSVKEKRAPIQKDPAIHQAIKPKIEVTDPSDELTDEKPETKIEIEKAGQPEVTAARFDVELDSSNKKYDFHYQFAGNKLVLYGSFDKSLYEILEINGDNHAVFLFYKETYYLLDQKQDKVTKLTPIKDGLLVKKLKNYRNR